MEDQLKRLYQLVDQFKVGKNWKTFVDAFIFGCKLRNLSPRTISVYAERLGYLARHLESKGVHFLLTANTCGELCRTFKRCKEAGLAPSCPYSLLG